VRDRASRAAETWELSIVGLAARACANILALSPHTIVAGSRANILPLSPLALTR
jgi:hypothetical protein